MSQEIVVNLNKFTPRDYQLPLFDAFENKGYRHALLIWPRRAGKDIAVFNLCIRAALTKVQVIYYIFPTYSQGKKVIFDSITNDGQRVLDFIPSELVESTNSQEMKIRFKNGSLLQIVGSDNYDSLMGTNPQLCVFSEYALQDPRAYQFIRPILAANAGKSIFLSTPRAKNHLWSLYEMARKSSDWFCQKLTLDDTKHIPLSEIEQDRAEGRMSEDLIQQEYYTSFTMGVQGAYYSAYIDKMRLRGQIGVVPWDPSHAVHTNWDLGVADSTTIIFWQSVGQTVRIIDCYDKNKEGLEHYVRVVKSKPYEYGKHFAPHDINVREFGSGITRYEKARQLGIKFEMRKLTNGELASAVPSVSIEDGIEAVRSSFSKVWIDEKECTPLLKALENYRQEFDIKLNDYRDRPLHDWSSHYADAMRYLCLSLSKTRDGLSAEELDQRYYEAMSRGNHLPNFFRDDIR